MKGRGVVVLALGAVVGDENSNADSTEAKGFADGGRVPCKLAALELLLHLACWREGLVDTAWSPSPSPLPVAGKSCPCPWQHTPMGWPVLLVHASSFRSLRLLATD